MSLALGMPPANARSTKFSITQRDVVPIPRQNLKCYDRKDLTDRFLFDLHG